MKYRHAIAIDLGATNVRTALVSERGEIIARTKQTTHKTGKNGAVVTTQIERMIEILIRKHPKFALQGIGISSMGPLDYKRGGPAHAPNVPFPFISLTKPLTKKFSLPVILLNDCNAGVFGERHFGAGKKVNNLVYVTISTGIGAGAIVDGKLLLGKEGNAGEVGHLIVDTHYNFPCTCGKGTGHWEGEASGRNIPRFFKVWAASHAQEPVSFTYERAEDIFMQARNKNANALAFLEEISRINARAISDIIVAYNPELITLGGSVVLHNSSIIIRGIKKYVERYLTLPKIQVTTLGEDITLLGAAAAVFKKGEKSY
ncbi:MAG: N-acylmannosamine kinase [Parcubacteria group bacterium Gr01-1014_48]|nr:MAG: N-acylmannosamine kinase [Parcubacteria group bacterium Greene0416_14]TSC74421.1 MAG: N-acylmannosamine kinase [Parcubacteria group bacterium Gr01-1014_48]TSD01274.1 MAG: N-acylmannosamine kinase [Parcubacteria group bacterium Greene1014_15]TSD08405.1 MAG: N-acylmannosamine kinase [Parcubacteria group bacterium Greene0714_4]